MSGQAVSWPLSWVLLVLRQSWAKRTALPDIALPFSPPPASAAALPAKLTAWPDSALSLRASHGRPEGFLRKIGRNSGLQAAGQAFHRLPGCHLPTIGATSLPYPSTGLAPTPNHRRRATTTGRPSVAIRASAHRASLTNGNPMRK